MFLISLGMLADSAVEYAFWRVWTVAEMVARVCGFKVEEGLKNARYESIINIIVLKIIGGPFKKYLWTT